MAVRFLCPQDLYLGAYCFCPVCLFVSNSNIGHNFWNNTGRDFIFGMHMYFMRPHILNANMSRSSLKVKGQISGSMCNWGHLSLTVITLVVFVLCVCFKLYMSHDIMMKDIYSVIKTFQSLLSLLVWEKISTLDFALNVIATALKFWLPLKCSFLKQSNI